MLSCGEGMPVFSHQVFDASCHNGQGLSLTPCCSGLPKNRGKREYAPFAQKLEMLSDDSDVMSLLGNRCCRSDRGDEIEMATSYPWLTSMSTATEKEDAVSFKDLQKDSYSLQENKLKDIMGPDPKAGEI